MREEEKELSGVLFHTGAPELLEKKKRAHMLSQKYNQIPEEKKEEREALIRELFAEVGDNFLFNGPIYVHYGSHTKIGKNFFANFNLTLQDDTYITIGDNCDFGPNCTLVTPLHPMLGRERFRMLDPEGNEKRCCWGKPIIIGNNVWLCANVIVLPGVTIGDNCVIGAGSVVLHDVPANCFAAGNPARVIREITEEESMVFKPEIMGDFRPRPVE